MDKPWIEINPDALAERLGRGDAPTLLDVRTLPEVCAYHIPGIVWIPLNDLADRLGALDPGSEIVVLCEHGVRSTIACRLLYSHGYRRLANLTGGMASWTGPIERGAPPQTGGS